MQKKPLVITLLVLATLGSVAWLHFAMPGRRPHIQLDPYRALGEVAAEETARLLNHQGQVVILAREDRSGDNPVESAELKTFNSTLKKGGVAVAATEWFKVPPTEQILLAGSVPRERFMQVVQAHPNVAAFVLFAEFPVL